MKKKISIAIVLALLLTMTVGCDAASSSKTSPATETAIRNTAFTLKATVPAAEKETEKNEKPAQDDVDAEGAEPAQTVERKLTVRVTAIKGKNISYESYSAPELTPEREADEATNGLYGWFSDGYDWGEDAYGGEYDDMTDEEFYAMLEEWFSGEYGDWFTDEEAQTSDRAEDKPAAENEDPCDEDNELTDEEFYAMLEGWLSGEDTELTDDEIYTMLENWLYGKYNELTGGKDTDGQLNEKSGELDTGDYADRDTDDYGYDYDNWYYGDWSTGDYADRDTGDYGYDYDNWYYGDWGTGDYADWDTGDYDYDYDDWYYGDWYSDNDNTDYDDKDAEQPEQPEENVETEPETGSVTVSDKSILFKREDGSETAAKLADIEVGSLLELTMDEDGNVTRIVILEEETEPAEPAEDKQPEQKQSEQKQPEEKENGGFFGRGDAEQRPGGNGAGRDGAQPGNRGGKGGSMFDEDSVQAA